MSQMLELILLIDDNEDDNFLNRRVLSKYNISHRIDDVKNGLEAIEYLTNTGEFAGKRENFPCPDIIFLDVNMPLMNGWEFMEEYDKLPEEAKGNQIIVMLTTSQNPDDIERAYAINGVSRYLTKPLKLENVKTIIEELFPHILIA